MCHPWSQDDDVAFHLSEKELVSSEQRRVMV